MKKFLTTALVMIMMLSGFNATAAETSAITLEYGDFYAGGKVEIVSQTVNAEGATLGDSKVVEVTADGKLCAVGLGNAFVKVNGIETKERIFSC